VFSVSNGNKRNRSGGGQGQGGGGGGNQQRRRRSGGGQGGGNQQQRPQMPNGPAMTALGESTYEAVFDHGGNGYGVWFDGVVREDPMYKQFWKGTGNRPLYVRIEEDKIVLLKELDRELPPSVIAANQAQADADAAENGPSLDVDAAIEEAVAEAMAAAEAAGADSETGEKVYSPEEAAALFAAGEAGGDAPAAAATVTADDQPKADEDAEEAPAKPKRRVATRKKAAPKKAAPADDE